tara:strand:+ start:2155 stop:2592 length:438 start_codon:yes stop_codon:yes gene_type:complete
MEKLNKKFGVHVFTKINKYLHMDKMNNLNQEYNNIYYNGNVAPINGIFRNDNGLNFNGREIGVINQRSLIRPNDYRITLYVLGDCDSLLDGIIRNISEGLPPWNTRLMRGKVCFIPKRYIFSSGFESLKGYKDIDEVYYNNCQNA